MFLELPGRVAIVTGAARGIGFAIAERLSQAGASVVIADIDEEGATAAVERLRKDGGKAAAAPADVTSPEEVGAMVERALEAFGKLDILVNNAGITGRDAPLWETTDKDWERVLGLNLTSTFFCLPGGSASHARAPERRNRQRCLHLGQGGEPEHDPLLGLEGRGDLPDQGAGQGGDRGRCT